MIPLVIPLAWSTTRLRPSSSPRACSSNSLRAAAGAQLSGLAEGAAAALLDDGGGGAVWIGVLHVVAVVKGRVVAHHSALLRAMTQTPLCSAWDAC